MSDDNDEYQEFEAHVRRNLIPKLKESSASVSILPEGEPDVKFSLELGLSVMLDKPIIAMVRPGVKLPAKLVAVADEIVEGDIVDGDHQKMMERLGDAIERIHARQEQQPTGEPGDV